MVPQGLITHIALIGLSVGIFFTYLQPSFTDVHARQDEVATYKNERAKVADVNKTLQKLVTDSAGISKDDKALVNRYLPDKVDEIEVQRDILLILDTMGIVPNTLSAGKDGPAPQVDASVEAGAPNLASALNLVPHHFNVGVTLSYEELIDLLGLFEQNAYPLDVVKIGIAASGPDEAGEDVVTSPGALSLELAITTYSLAHTDKSE